MRLVCVVDSRKPSQPEHDPVKLFAVNIYSHLVGSIISAIFVMYSFRAEIPTFYAIAATIDEVSSVCFTWMTTCFCLSTVLGSDRR